jgi:hypothetical protein
MARRRACTDALTRRELRTEWTSAIVGAPLAYSSNAVRMLRRMIRFVSSA